MNNPELAEIERNIMGARARLAHNVAQLRSAEALAELKDIVTQEVSDTKDNLMQTARSGAQSALQTALQQIKSKAIANPAAVGAVGAGLAWKLFRSPPIASAMVGLGLYSLLRTRGDASLEVADAPRQLKRQVSEFAGEVSGQIAGTAKEIGHRASELAGSAGDAARGIASETADYATDLAARAMQSGKAAVTEAKDYAEELVTRGLGTSEAESPYPIEHMDEQPFVAAPPLADHAQPPRDARDALLLGAAGIAVAAALGIAYQRARDD